MPWWPQALHKTTKWDVLWCSSDAEVACSQVSTCLCCHAPGSIQDWQSARHLLRHYPAPRLALHQRLGGWISGVGTVQVLCRAALSWVCRASELRQLD